jgi:hypothetical protein
VTFDPVVPLSKRTPSTGTEVGPLREPVTPLNELKEGRQQGLI